MNTVVDRYASTIGLSDVNARHLDALESEAIHIPVSYTHLTLPTKA